PRRRDDGLARAQGDLGVLAVGVGHLQFVGVAALEHVGDARGKHAAYAGDFFVDAVGDLVRDAAQLGFAAGEGHVVELAALDRVGQPVADLVAAVTPARDGSIGQRVGAARAPLVVVNGRVDGQVRATGADQPELARAS